MQPATLPTKNAVTLEQHYYLDNFNYLIDFVSQHYRHLLSSPEKDFCNAYTSLPVNARQLFVRLASRKSDFLRTSKLHYPEIDSVANAIITLASVDFIGTNTEIDELEFNRLFSQQEINSVLPGARPKTRAMASASATTTATPLEFHILDTPDLFGDTPRARLLHKESIIEVHHKQHIVTFRLLFFGNLHQDFSSFVLRDLGLQRYENYNIDNDTLLFNSRTQLDAYLQLYQCTDQFEAACDEGTDSLMQLFESLPIVVDEDKTLVRRLDKLKLKIARQLEREQSTDNAELIYRQTTRPPARERLARLEAKKGCIEQSVLMCKAIQASPYDIEELEFANTFGKRLAHKTEQNFTSPAPHDPPELSLQLCAENLSVEFCVALHLAKTGHCCYVENSLFNGIFGLAFWDIIFAPVSGVFFHPFQNAPADFYEPEFHQQREQLIQSRLNEISEGNLQHFVFKHFYQKHGLRNPMVNWGILKQHLLSKALKRIPIRDWIEIFAYMLSDIRNTRSGQPDLVYFPDNGSYQLLEVKAPGDRLQKNQLRWMQFFNDKQISHAVVHVEWCE